MPRLFCLFFCWGDTACHPPGSGEQVIVLVFAGFRALGVCFCLFWFACEALISLCPGVTR